MNNITSNLPEVKPPRTAIAITLHNHHKYLDLIRAKLRVRGFVCYAEIKGLMSAYDALAKAAITDAHTPKMLEPKERASVDSALTVLSTCQELSIQTRQFLQEAMAIRTNYPRAFNSLSLNSGVV